MSDELESQAGAYPTLIVEARYGGGWYAYPAWWKNFQDHPTQKGDNDWADFMDEGSVGERLMGRGDAPDSAFRDMLSRIVEYEQVCPKWVDELNDWYRADARRHANERIRGPLLYNSEAATDV